MPKKRSAEEYTADDGFVVDDEGGAAAPVASDEDMSERPVAKSRDRKKQKTVGASSSGAGAGAGSGAGGGVPGGGARDKDGHEYWEISGKRRLQISEYSGKRMVNIREFYEDKKSGEMLPGKKGISLTMEQYDAIIELLPHIETVLVGKGHHVARPDYDAAAAGGEGAGAMDEDEPEEEEEADDDEEEEDGDGGGGGGGGGKSGKSIGKKKKGTKMEKVKKRNFEETSDEE